MTAPQISWHTIPHPSFRRRPESSEFNRRKCGGITTNWYYPFGAKLDSFSAPRKPTPKQIARWEAVHAAKRRGLSIRAITRETGIHRKTVGKYLKTDSPPMNRPRVMLKAS